MTLASRIRQTSKLIAINLLVLLGMLLLIECGLSWLLNHPPRSNNFIKQGLRKYYSSFERAIIQYLPECAQYDKRLGYTLKPGSCQFKNREFDTVFDINTLGVRDDEASLEAPRIVVAGDSYAMGWGVEQDQTFAQIVEEKTGKKVLNTGISSYGTTREMTLLKKVDTSRMEYLIIQYADNDYWENRAAARDVNNLRIIEDYVYNHIVDEHARETRYYPGKYILHLVPGIARKWLGIPDEEVLPPNRRDTDVIENEVMAFLNVLMNVDLDLRNVKIIVFDVMDASENPVIDNKFTSQLQRELESANYPSQFKNMIVLDLSSGLDPEMHPDWYYPLDQHLNADGHRYIADELLEAMAQ